MGGEGLSGPTLEARGLPIFLEEGYFQWMKYQESWAGVQRGSEVITAI